ncbi:hypothetical protein FS837_001678 [Tulasnella sp. UAMH 9824]|nr:hypothetical protein FS837_001678 [Tulasnella sp. UAMH 9824]
MDSLAPPGHRSSLKSPAHHSLSLKKSANSLRNSESLDGGGPHRVSLAHELAAAMMPEPNVTSQMLAEEFGLDFDDGGDGEEEDIDAFAATRGEQVDDPYISHGQPITPPTQTLDHLEGDGIEFGQGNTAYNGSMMDETDEFQTTFGSSSLAANGRASPQAKQDPLDLLAQNLKATDLFITQLRHVDAEQSAGTASEPPLERAAASMIGRLNDLSRERETQVRTIQEYDRELKKMVEDVSWHDALGQLDPLENVEDLLDPSEKVKDSQTEEDHSRTPTAVRTYSGESHVPSRRQSGRRGLYQVEEEEEREEGLLGDDPAYDNDQYDYDVPSPGKLRKHMSLPPAPPDADVPTPSSTLPQFSYVRTLTQSLSQSLTSLSEHAQVNGVNTTEAGRKLRALKNKIVELKADWDSADRSRVKIERWEAGLIDDLTIPDSAEDSSPELSFSSPSSRDTSLGPETPEIASGPKLPSRRIDGRKLVEEQLEGFRHALEEAAQKTQAIMAT